MSIAEDAMNDVIALVDELGVPISMVLVEPGSGPEPIATETAVSVKGIIQNNVKRWSPWETQDGDRLITLPATALSRPPRRGDMVLLEGERWPVVNMRMRAIQGQTLAFTLQLRR